MTTDPYENNVPSAEQHPTEETDATPNTKTGAIVSNSYENAHEVIKGDPRSDGPYLDDIRKAQEDEYRNQRMEGLKKLASQKSADNPADEEEAAKSEEEKTPAEALAWAKANVVNPNVVEKLNPVDPAEVIAQEHFGAATYREKDAQDPTIPNDATPFTQNMQRDKKLMTQEARQDVEVDESDVPPRTKKSKKQGAKKAPVALATPAKKTAPTKKTVAKKTAAAKKAVTPAKKTAKK